MEFDWDEDNIEHISRHGLEPADVEEAYEDQQRRYINVYSTPQEKRVGFIGITSRTELIVVVLTTRVYLDDVAKLRCVTARLANDWEKSKYRSRK